MNSPLIIVIVTTVLASLKGFKDANFVQKYLFQVGEIKHRKQYYRILTSGFLHADMMHLFFNMLTLYFFSPIVLYAYGEVGFFVIYLGSILVGNAFSLYIYRTQVYYSALGASGGVSGILFAAIAIAPSEISVNFLPGYIFGLVYFGYSVYMMLNPKHWDNLGHAAHLGGAALGLVYAIVARHETALMHLRELLIMSLPLIYLAFRVFTNKKLK